MGLLSNVTTEVADVVGVLGQGIKVQLNCLQEASC